MRPTRPRRRSKVGKVVLWTLGILGATTLGGLVAAYHYVTEGDSVADLIRREAPRYLPRCRVDLLRARIKPVVGEVILQSLTIGDRPSDLPGSGAAGGPSPAGSASGGPIGPGGPASLANLPQVTLRYNPWAMLHGRFELTEVTVYRPTIRLRHRDDGTWNIEGLLADPWPGPRGGATPPIVVHEGTVELVAGSSGAPLKVLTAVEVSVPASDGASPIAFELDAKGDLCERINLRGEVDPESGRVACEHGELVRLNLSDSLRNRLPLALGETLSKLGLSAGEVDASWSSLIYDPSDPEPVHIQGSARLRRGIWQCPRLPFPISDVAIDLEIHDRQITLESAKGTDGATTIALRGQCTLGDPNIAPFAVEARATGLQLDNRLRSKTPPKFLDIWDLYFPEVARSPIASAGRIDLTLRVGRDAPQGPIHADADIDLVDVAMQYKHFPYRVEHVQGRMHLTPERLTLTNVRTNVGNGPLVVQGIVDDPGPNARAELHFDVRALPVDDPRFLAALPRDVAKVVNDFRPTGTVRGSAVLVRLPPKPGGDPMGPVTFDAEIDLNPGCSATWTGLKYPVRELTGHLGIHPNRWDFQGMRGSNGQATIEVNGQVLQIRRKEFRVGLTVQATNLPFDNQLRDALPRPWQKAWATLSPTGASDFEATVRAEPGQPEHTQIRIRPRPQTSVTLRFDPVAAPGTAAPLPLELRMDDVGGLFEYDYPPRDDKLPLTMSDVSFRFHRAGVTFRYGQVDVQDMGKFQLGVTHLEVADLLLDEELRRMMPPVMATFARRLDDRKLPKLRADLGLGWSGRPGESAWCQWKNGLVILSKNKLEIGGEDIALEHIEGQLDGLKGAFDGRKLDLDGQIALASVALQGQHLTDVAARLEVHDGEGGLGHAVVVLNRGTLLGGAVAGRVASTLEATPRYEVELGVDGARLEEYAKDLPGHQTFKGKVSGDLQIRGSGYELRSLTGSGMARVVEGDLGSLPVLLHPFALLKQNDPPAFDSAEVVARINNGETAFSSIRLLGQPFSLDGRGTLDVHGILDLKLEPIPGRDSDRFRHAKDLFRGLTGLIGVIRIDGPIASPNYHIEPIPIIGDSFRSQSRLWSAIRANTDEPNRLAVPPRRAGTIVR